MDEKLLGHEGGDVPGGEILESYEAHEVVASLGVIPRTRSILPEYKPCKGIIKLEYGLTRSCHTTIFYTAI